MAVSEKHLTSFKMEASHFPNLQLSTTHHNFMHHFHSHMTTWQKTENEISVQTVCATVKKVEKWMVSRCFVVLYRGSTCSDCLFWL